MKESVPQIKVVALIGASHLVTDQEVIEAVRQRLGEFRDLPGPARTAKEKELYTAELRRIIERELILDDMYAKLKKQGRLALADEIKEFAEKAADQSLRSIRNGYGLKTDEEFQAVLRMQGLTQPVIRRQIERQIMADEYVRSAIKEKGRTPGFADIRAYYERTSRRVQVRRPRQVARHLHQLQQARDAARPRCEHAEHVSDCGSGMKGGPRRRLRRAGQAVRQRPGFRRGRRRRRQQTRRDSAAGRGEDRLVAQARRGEPDRSRRRRGITS